MLIANEHFQLAWLMQNYFKMSISTFETFAVIADLTVPVLRIIIFLSAVKMREGRIFEAIGNEPLIKSEELISTV